MPLCEGCGASYEDNYKFCPHCGRAKLESPKIIIEHRAFDDERMTRKDVLKIINTGGEFSMKYVGNGKSEPVFRANLSGVNLSGVDLSGLDLSGVSFRGANFIEANLSKANLKNALVSLSHFTNANLKESNLSHANFIKSHLNGADLSGTCVDGAIFREADFTNAIFINAYYVSKSPDWYEAVINKNQMAQVKETKKSFLDKLLGA